MAMSTGGGGGRRAHSRRFRPMADINVTPMVDVMLVLLVIFMVTAPLLTAGVQIDLPKTQASAIKGEDQPLSISVDAKGGVWLQETSVPLEELAPKVQAIIAQKPETRIFVRGDKTVDYGRVMEVMGTLNAAGIEKVALVTEQRQDTPASTGRRAGSR